MTAFMILLGLITAAWAGWYFGQLYGYYRGHKDTRTIYTIHASKSMEIRIAWEDVDQLLERRGLVAVPRGTEQLYKRESEVAHG